MDFEELRVCGEGEAMSVHELKTCPREFNAVVSGVKRFEFRRNDRGYRTGDTLRLCKWDPKREEYFREIIEVRVTYVARGPAFGIPNGFCVMSIRHRGEP